MCSCKRWLIALLLIFTLNACATVDQVMNDNRFDRLESDIQKMQAKQERYDVRSKLTATDLMEMMEKGEAGWEAVYSALTAAASGDYLIVQDISDTTDGSAGTTKYILVDGLYSGIFPVLIAEPTEVVGRIYIADNDNWNPASYTGTNDYMVLCTATDTYKLLMDMVTGERFFSEIDMSDGIMAIPSSTNPTTDSAGECSLDYSDGGQIPLFLECYDEGTGAASRIIASDIICESYAIIEPDNAQAANDDPKLKHFAPIAYPHGATIVYVSVATDGTDISDAFGFEEWSDEDTVEATIETITLTTADFGESSSIDNPDMDQDHYLVIDLDASSDDYEACVLTVCFRIDPGD